MSGLGDVRIRRGNVAAWAVQVVLLIGLAACSSGSPPPPRNMGASGQGPERGVDVNPPPPPAAPANAGTHAAVTSARPAPAQAAPELPPRMSAARPAPRPPGELAAARPRRSTDALRARPPAGHTYPSAPAHPVPPLQTAARVDAAAPAIRAADVGADLASYIARVSATDHFELPGAKGLLTVWIGLAQNLPQATAGTASATQSLGMRGQTATIAPFAPDFEVDPASTVCERIVPSGSAVNFALVPKRAGELTVGANVQLFDSADCSGVPVPKSTSLIRVQVQVCRMCYVQSGLASLGLTAWNAFTQFWAWLLGVVFLTLGILINRWRRRRFHISKADEASGPGGVS